MGWQHIDLAELDKAADAQAKILAFLGTKPNDLNGDAMTYQAIMDWGLWAVQNIDDVQAIKLLEFIGRPLTNNEFTAWFFGR
jgi:hypothetical protein